MAAGEIRAEIEGEIGADRDGDVPGGAERRPTGEGVACRRKCGGEGEALLR